MKRAYRYHVLFALSLVALAALAVWWTVFIKRSVELESQFKLLTLEFHAARAAADLGVEATPPPVGTLPGGSLEVVYSGGGSMLAGAHPCLPRHPTAAVRPAAAVMKAVEQKRYRRQVMLYGEASLLFLLIGVCTFMLYQIVSQEHRFRHRMEDFVAAVTHEMKTPLTGIKSLLQTVVARKVPGAELPRLCGMGLKESERLEHMVENVLLAGRLRVEELRLVPEPLSLRPFLERFLEHRRQYLPDRPERLKLAWDLSELEASVRADPRALSTILENLTDNAFKYGGEEPDVTVRVSREGTRIYLAVEDTGVGFEAQAAPELFRPFHREWSDSQAVSHGAGLGLAIAAALAARMDAELAASSEGPGRGSRFTVKCREIRT